MALTGSRLASAVAYNKRSLSASWPDADFTRNVEAFQTAYNSSNPPRRLDTDGKVGPSTRSALAVSARVGGLLPPLHKWLALAILKQMQDRRSIPPAPDRPAPLAPAPAPVPQHGRPAPAPYRQPPPGGQLGIGQAEAAARHNTVAAEEYRMRVGAPYTGPHDRRLANDIWALQLAEDIDTHAPGMVTARVVGRLKQISGKPPGGNPAGMRLSQGVSFAVSKLLLIGGGLALLAGVALAVRRSTSASAEGPATSEHLVEMTPEEYAAVAGVPAPRANPYFDEDLLDADDDGGDDADDDDADDYDGVDEDDYDGVDEDEPPLSL